VTAAGQAPAPAVTSRSWIATGWNIHLLYGRSPALARHFFDTPRSYGTGTDPAKSPVIDGFAATPVLRYTSGRQLASDLRSGALTYPYRWVLYDPEHWPHTPLAEQQDPGSSMRRFARLAHAHGLTVIESPSRDLGLATGSVCPLDQGETLNSWYLRCNVAGLAAAHGDAVIIQDQANEGDPAVYGSLFNTAKQQALAASPGIGVVAALSTNRGSPTEMIAAAKSVTASGYYVTIRRHALDEVIEFFKAMKTAGY
jgi:hypothetical protein